MKRLMLLSGMSLLAAVSFSQQVSSERSAVIKPIENKETIPVEVVSDSVVIVHSMARNGKPVTVSKETESNTIQQTEKVTTVSSARKPD